MKRITSILALSAFALCLSIAAFAQQGSTTSGSSAATTTTPPATDAKPAKHMHHAAAKMAPVDINSASKEDLMKLKGIDDAAADKIIAGRPYKSKAQLVSKTVLTKAQYAKIKSHVVAKQEASASK
jgi:DNA uptake protein ComE-like DNA-binding protein